MRVKSFIFLFIILFITLLSFGFADREIQTGGINCEGNPPVAIDDSYETPRNIELNVDAPGVLYYDSDEDGDTLTAVLDTYPSHGTLNLNPDGSFIYNPDVGFTGVDIFTYHATDGCFNSNIATVGINLINYPPFAENDSYVTARNETLNVAAPGVLSNDFDGNGDILSVMWSIEGPFHGNLSLQFDGSFVYHPDEGFVGEDWFSYAITDGDDHNWLPDPVVTITVSNGFPTAADDNYQTEKNVVLNVTAPGILCNDTDVNGDPLTAVVDVQPTNGILTLNSDGSFTYTPNTDYVGTDSFTYHANDGVNDSNIATVNLTINLYSDNFNDGSLDPNWTYVKPAWTESGGTLIGTPTTRKAVAVATPGLFGCQTCSMEASMSSAGGAFNKVWMLGWYVDKKNTLELLMNEENDRWILKQRVNGSVVAKAKGIKRIDPNTHYDVRISFDGVKFQVFVDDFVTPLITLIPKANVPAGTVGFQVKNTTGSFDYVAVN